MKFAIVAVIVWTWLTVEIVQYLVDLDHQIEMQDRV